MSSLHRLPPGGATVVGKDESIEGTVTPIEDIENNDKPYGKWFESIHIFNDESVVIASDTLQGLKIEGFVTKYERIQDVPQMPVLSLAPGFGGICNLIALRDKRLICGYDSGNISILNADLEEEHSGIYHDHLISRVSINRLETKTVSCGYDYNIVVLDLQTLRAYKYYNFSHSAIIWDIDFSPSDDNLLLSCSRDRDVLLWDLRKARPASKVSSLDSEPTALCWSAKDISHTFIGTDCGQILQFDVRKPGHEVNVTFDSIVNRVHRIKSVFNGNALSVCADDNVFRLISPEMKCIYEDMKSHTDWIRDSTQHKGQIYTCGRDAQLVCHSELKALC